jgi:hypothetical protein
MYPSVALTVPGCPIISTTTASIETGSVILPVETDPMTLKGAFPTTELGRGDKIERTGNLSGISVSFY